MQIKNKIVIVPLKPAPKTKDLTYLMLEKPMYGSGITQLEFPSGSPGEKEPLDSAAKRIFLQETGFDPAWVKFLYRILPEPQVSPNHISVFLGLALKESDSAHAIVNLDGDGLLNKIRENEIVCGTSLAAFAAVLLQGQEAKKYLIQSQESDKSEGISNEKI
jgi:8-oxo-dGTP pyrophosphatase MutT (NUDIX family)